MTRPDHTTSAHTLPGKRRAFEGVARRLDAGGTTARTLPRTPVRTPTSQPPPPAQRWVRKCDRSIKESDTPQQSHLRRRPPDIRLHPARGLPAPANGQGPRRDGRARPGSDPHDPRRNQHQPSRCPVRAATAQTPEGSSPRTRHHGQVYAPMPPTARRSPPTPCSHRVETRAVMLREARRIRPLSAGTAALKSCARPSGTPSDVND